MESPYPPVKHPGLGLVRLTWSSQSPTPESVTEAGRSVTMPAWAGLREGGVPRPVVCSTSQGGSRAGRSHPFS